MHRDRKGSNPLINQSIDQSINNATTILWMLKKLFKYKHKMVYKYINFISINWRTSNAVPVVHTTRLIHLPEQLPLSQAL